MAKTQIHVTMHIVNGIHAAHSGLQAVMDSALTGHALDAKKDKSPLACLLIVVGVVLLLAALCVALGHRQTVPRAVKSLYAP